MTSVADAVKLAKENAAAMAAVSPTTSPTVIEGRVDNTGVATTFRKPSMASVASTSGVIPKTVSYLKVKEFGLLVGKNKDFIETIRATINMTEDKGFQVKETLCFGASPVIYLSTFDGIRCDKGGSWNDAWVKAANVKPNIEAYPAVDFVFTLTEDLALKAETVKAGTQMGHTTSKTNFDEWSAFWAECNEAGLLGTTVNVELGFREINHNKNTWGVVTFKLLD